MAPTSRVPKSAPRYAVDAALSAEGKTLGSSASYLFVVENISRTGLLLASGEGDDVPFRANTLIELTIDPGCQLLSAPVRCIAKVIRAEIPGGAPRSAAESTKPNARCGVTIVQIEPAHQMLLDQFLADLAKRHDWKYDGAGGQYWLKRA